MPLKILASILKIEILCNQHFIMLITRDFFDGTLTKNIVLRQTLISLI